MRYGIWNAMRKEFQFGIAEDTKEQARKKLFDKIGKDSYKWRFEVRALTEGKGWATMREVFDKLERQGEFTMANATLAESYYERLKPQFPQLVVIHNGIYQIFIHNNDDGKRLRKARERLKHEHDYSRKRVAEHEHALKQIDDALRGDPFVTLYAVPKKEI